MIMWADLLRKDGSSDVEYGGGFALNCILWVTALLWIVWPKSSVSAPASEGYGYTTEPAYHAAGVPAGF